MTFELGDFVKVPDGRIGTVVYNGLDGIGIIWGKIELTKEDRAQILNACPLFENGVPPDYKWQPKAMLRAKLLEKLLGMECVGEEEDCEVESKSEAHP